VFNATFSNISAISWGPDQTKAKIKEKQWPIKSYKENYILSIKHVSHYINRDEGPGWLNELGSWIT
jgi:hypothetical protein